MQNTHPGAKCPPNLQFTQWLVFIITLLASPSVMQSEYHRLEEKELNHWFSYLVYVIIACIINGKVQYQLHYQQTNRHTPIILRVHFHVLRHKEQWHIQQDDRSHKVPMCRPRKKLHNVLPSGHNVCSQYHIANCHNP